MLSSIRSGPPSQLTEYKPPLGNVEDSLKKHSDLDNIPMMSYNSTLWLTQIYQPSKNNHWFEKDFFKLILISDKCHITECFTNVFC